jgi:hypothetical protein
MHCSVTFSTPLTTLQNTIPKILNKYFQKGNCADSVQISTFMCHWAISIFPRSVCLFCCRKICGPIWEYINRSQTHKCGNWDWGCTIPFLWIHNWDFRCSVDSEVKKWKTLFDTGRKETLYLTPDFMGSLRPWLNVSPAYTSMWGSNWKPWKVVEDF